MICSNCGFEITDETVNCPNCNYLIEKNKAVQSKQILNEEQTSENTNQKLCLNCGNMNELGDEFCIKCGTKTSNIPIPQDTQVLQAKENELNFLRYKVNELSILLSQKPKKGGVLKILSLCLNGVFLFVLVIALVIGVTTSSNYIKDKSELGAIQKQLTYTKGSVSRLQEILNSVVSDQPIIATNITLSNTDKNSKEINGNQESYINSDIRYMSINFDLTKLDDKYDFTGKKVYVKFVDCFGDVMTYASGAKSPQGYTDSVDIGDGSYYVSIGNDKTSIFNFGTYFVGIYFEGKLIGSAHFIVK